MDTTWRGMRKSMAMLFALCAAPAVADEYAAAPWQFGRDANPFVAASGLPFAPPAFPADDNWHVDGVLAASNTVIMFDRADEHLDYDMEVHEARIGIARSLGDHWIARATTALVRMEGGFLDGFIEDFHHAFGLPNGDRSRLPHDGHTIRYVDAQGERIALTRSRSGMAPLMLDLAWRAPADGHEWLLGGTLKLPTSHASVLIDDRSTDLALWSALQSTNASRLRWGLRGGVLLRNDPRLIADRAHGAVPFADGVMGWQFTPRWDLAAQYQWHGAPYESAIPMLKAAGTLTLSSGWRLRSGWSLRAGLVEDLPARHAQDVSFFIGLAR